MNRRVTSAFALIALIAAGCASDKLDTVDPGDEETTSTTAAGGAGATDAKFGTLDNPCKKGDAKVADGEVGGGQTLKLGVPNDRTFSVAPGILKEMWETSSAMVTWCNELGGFSGQQIELVDLDAAYSNVEQAMGTACGQTFAMVGGGFINDDKMWTGKDGSDFSGCKMIEIPSWVVSPKAASEPRVVQPIPNPPTKRPSAWLEDLGKLYPDATKKLVVVYGNTGSLKSNAEQIEAVAKGISSPWTVGTAVDYNPLTPDFRLIASQVISQQATSVSWVGEPNNLAKAAEALKSQGYEGLIFTDSNEYDPVLINAASGTAVEGIVVRSVFHPFEEADKWPATKQFLEINKKYNVGADGEPGKYDNPLAMQSFSALLLFGTAFNVCAAKGPVTRECVLAAAKEQTAWTGGGLHAAGDPSTNSPSNCSLLIQVKDGTFTRLYPTLGSKEASDDGFSCPEPGIVEMAEQ